MVDPLLGGRIPMRTLRLGAKRRSGVLQKEVDPAQKSRKLIAGLRDRLTRLRAKRRSELLPLKDYPIAKSANGLQLLGERRSRPCRLRCASTLELLSDRRGRIFFELLENRPI